MAANSPERLTERQKEVLWLVRKGFTNPEIAEQLGISRRSAKECVSQLLLLYDVSNRTELAGLVQAGGPFPAGS